MADVQDSAALLKAAQAVAKIFTSTRPTFRQFYDAMVGSLGRSDLPRSFMQAVVVAGRRVERAGLSALDAADDRAAYTLALFALGSREGMASMAISAVAEGLCDPPGAIDAKRTHARTTATGAIRSAVGYQGKGMMPVGIQPQRGEAITDPNSTWTSPQALYPGVLLAIRRLCKVSTRDASNRPTAGTGFLIGPSAVLTNWHVIKDAINRAKPGIKVQFDHIRPGARATAVESYEVADEWLGSNTKMGPEQPAAAGTGWWIDVNQREAWQEGLTDCLDYAVIMLKGAPGRQRGWYDLATIPGVTTGSCWAFHHPSGQGQTITGGSFVFVDGADPVRAFHTAPTMGGSSGGLILDDAGQPVALHHSALGDDKMRADGTRPRVPEDTVNVAVPLAAIAAKIGGDLNKIQDEGRFSLPGGCLDGKRPLFGRDDLLASIESLIRGTHRVLWVKPPETGTKKKPGKSYSFQVLKALLPPPGNIFIEFTADQVKAGGREMAEMILKRLAPTTTVGLPQPEEGGTTETAYFANHLVTVLRDMIKSGFADNTIWIVIDDLDIHNLTDAGGRRFLHVLYQRVEDIPQLRIVLIGLKAALPSIPTKILRLSTIERELSEPKAIRELFEKWLLVRGARERGIEQKVLTMVAEVAVSFAGDEAPLEGLARFATEYLDKPLTKLLEEL
jgi:hypothetical protein